MVPGGGDVKIESQKLNFKEKAQAKVGSLDNVGHLPAGGAVKVVNRCPGGGSSGGRVVWLESGSQQVGACHRPSVSTCRVSPAPSLFPLSVISPEQGRRGKGALPSHPSPVQLEAAPSPQTHGRPYCLSPSRPSPEGQGWGRVPWHPSTLEARAARNWRALEQRGIQP